MDREEAINHIESLYPPDDDYSRTAEIGNELLEQARSEVTQDWRKESDAVLIRFAELSLMRANI